MATQTTFGCAICTESFDAHKKVCATRCGHVYHENCIQMWMQTQTRQSIPTNCPKCRATVTETLRLFLHQVSAAPSDFEDISESECESIDTMIDSDTATLSPISTSSVDSSILTFPWESDASDEMQDSDEGLDDFIRDHT